MLPNIRTEASFSRGVSSDRSSPTARCYTTTIRYLQLNEAASHPTLKSVGFPGVHSYLSLPVKTFLDNALGLLIHYF
ncbi:hypothetical protein MFUM_290024 [Methylacidiphilum fumariolicum SolV]|uniref:Uncharacterized protein n=2 Tax=Candidatus Methylacidiphilum fumarolicum TaxID=591154 RepID=I0JXQ2_METFB|nr:conserved protein of unknown function [Candidatus Methylacidiphilum fumarolicum]CCG92021.1 hypothetical protein MFUM_290024 [Methylacidiphilum fumariolicum SolV]